MATSKEARKEAAVRFMKDDLFRKNAWLIIDKMVAMSPEHPSELVDEILHSIFFLGKINQPPVSPEKILGDKETLNKLRVTYPGPFKYYSSHLPRRSPFSCVLDMVVHQLGEENEDKIKQKLKEFTLDLRENGSNLVSSTICVSQRNKTTDSVRHYGVSMSTSGCNPGRILIAASCLSTWDTHVADAVMTYYPTKVKKEYFDGTITLPEQVRCESFTISSGKKMPPCRSCGNLFGLTTDEMKEWPYGNCAEAESVSNLLKNENKVREEVELNSPQNSVANRDKVRQKVLEELESFLRCAKLRLKEVKFYPVNGLFL